MFVALASSAAADGEPGGGERDRERQASADKPSPEELEEAHARFQAAENEKGAGNYEEAAKAYLSAHEILPEPEFLYNAGMMFVLANDDERARRYLEAYLEHDPGGRGSEQAERTLDDLGPAESDVTSEPQPAPRAEPTPGSGADDETGPLRGRPLRIASLALGGAGLVALGTGGYFGVRTRQIHNEAEDLDVYDPDLVSRGESFEVATLVLTGVGVAALVAGGALYYIDRRSHDQAADTGVDSGVVTVPIVSPTMMGVRWEGRF